MNFMDPKAILDGRAKRGVPAGVIVTITISSVCLAVFLAFWFLQGGGSFIVATLLAIMTLVPMMAGVLALDRVEPEPRYLLAATFLWGAGVSIVASIIFEMLGASAYEAGSGGNADAVTAVVLAPIVEETMKGLAVFALFWFRRSDINSITDGVVYAATSALGFAAAENIEYYINASSDAGDLAFTFIVRGVLDPFGHPLYTSMTGIAIALAIRSRSQAKRVLLPLGGLALAMILHAIWNGSSFFGIGGLAVGFLIEVGVLIAVLVALRTDRKRTVAQIQACAAQYVPTGLVTQADLIMLSSLKTRKQARNWARATQGTNGFNAMRDYQLACTKLSTLHDSAINGTVTPPNFEARRSSLLALMRVARQVFLGAQHRAVPMMAMAGGAPQQFAQAQFQPQPQFSQTQFSQPQPQPQFSQAQLQPQFSQPRPQFSQPPVAQPQVRPQPQFAQQQFAQPQVTPTQVAPPPAISPSAAQPLLAQSPFASPAPTPVLTMTPSFGQPPAPPLTHPPFSPGPQYTAPSSYPGQQSYPPQPPPAPAPFPYTSAQPYPSSNPPQATYPGQPQYQPQPRRATPFTDPSQPSYPPANPSQPLYPSVNPPQRSF
ncbi:MAG: PrsW family glutamic-type intramembrane protease [Propionibacteriaceae bacterium]|nr:PrsW family glutamic-type intramembrane protease [Propionibacteriaceae bacterium]